MKKQKLVRGVLLSVALAGAGFGTATLNVEAEDQMEEIVPANPSPYQVNVDDNTTSSEFEQEMRKSLYREVRQHEKIPVSDPRMARVQEVFSVVEQPFEKPLEKPRKGRPDKMSIDPLTGDARYTNGLIINREGRVTKRPESFSPSRGQLVPLIRTLTTELRTMANQPYSERLGRDIVIKINELETYTDSLDLTELTGLLIEISHSITKEKEGFTHSVKALDEIDRLINFDKKY
ncbi:hypothetical protein DFP93_12840 [Aneurinibacillus soli]|uniref:Uncharacterized protein n=1 Tax=Aneurinibacillus soli TaxID=1500254 RepID=A0A0U5AR02_9BACL|nr:hypothetical protein [Aneurinibacillus soli]PYE57816.1 hypothetical protein DFP93_12840 [Aneurinibacillus soli]BAU26229.1 hypothetical protein CB4_00338 [Aneurinibacillus soli]